MYTGLFLQKFKLKIKLLFAARIYEYNDNTFRYLIDKSQF